MGMLKFNTQAAQFDRVNALGLGRAAKLAYEDEAPVKEKTQAWGFPDMRFFDKGDTQAFLIANATTLILAFRGTEPMKAKDWKADAKFRQVDAYGGEVHRGFKKALDQVVGDVEREIGALRTQGQALWVTGHSLGAALAILCVAYLKQRAVPVQGIYTFGAPRVGDKKFAQGFNADFAARTFRFVNNNDVVTRMPPRALDYSHVGTVKYFDADGHLQNDLSYWKRFLDRFEGRVDDFLKPGTDGINDHSMDRYLACLERCQ